MDLIEEQIREPLKHWYYRHKFKAIKRELKSLGEIYSIVDIGAGSALFSKELIKFNDEITLHAIDSGYKTEGTDLMNSKIKYYRSAKSILGNLYLFTDVLEHVENDKEFLRFYANPALIGSKFIITVPCFMSLWSYHDVYLKHYRRYNLKELNALVRSCNLDIINSYYLYVAPFPIAYLSRKWKAKSNNKSQLREPGFLENLFFRIILSFDRSLARLFKFGISAIVVAEKNY